MRIAVCDDEEKFLFELKNILDSLCFEADLRVDTFIDGISLETLFAKDPYDVVFLDIEMGKENGIDVARRIREMNEKTYIIFLTSHIEYAIEGYEVNALRYMTKPAEKDKVIEIMRYIFKKQKESRTISIKYEGENVLLPVTDILYLESMDKYVKIHMEKKYYIVRSNLNEFEERLKDDNFVRIHRCFVINPGKVVKFSKNGVTLSNNEEIPIARGKEAGLREALFSFVDREAF